jgi:hypothetical protein
VSEQDYVANVQDIDHRLRIDTGLDMNDRGGSGGPDEQPGDVNDATR